MSFADLDIEKLPTKISPKLLQLVASDFGQLKEDSEYINLVNRMVDKLMVGGIVFHKHYI